MNPWQLLFYDLRPFSSSVLLVLKCRYATWPKETEALGTGMTDIRYCLVQSPPFRRRRDQKKRRLSGTRMPYSLLQFTNRLFYAAYKECWCPIWGERFVSAFQETQLSCGGERRVFWKIQLFWRQDTSSLRLIPSWFCCNMCWNSVVWLIHAP